VKIANYRVNNDGYSVPLNFLPYVNGYRNHVQNWRNITVGWWWSSRSGSTNKKQRPERLTAPGRPGRRLHIVRYIVERLVQAIPALFGVTVFVFSERAARWRLLFAFPSLP